jgi:hypothetical protein
MPRAKRPAGLCKHTARFFTTADLFKRQRRYPRGLIHIALLVALILTNMRGEGDASDIIEELAGSIIMIIPKLDDLAARRLAYQWVHDIIVG